MIFHLQHSAICSPDKLYRNCIDVRIQRQRIFRQLRARLRRHLRQQKRLRQFDRQPPVPAGDEVALPEKYVAKIDIEKRFDRIDATLNAIWGELKQKADK